MERLQGFVLEKLSQVRGVFTLRVLLRAVVLLALGAVAVVAAVSAFAQPRQARVVNPFLRSSRSAAVLFVPLDSHAARLARAVVPALRPWMTSSQVTAIASAGRGWANANRGGELNSDAVTKGLFRRFQAAQGRRPIILMAITSEAVYAPRYPQALFVSERFRGSGRSTVACWARVQCESPGVVANAFG